MYSVQYKIWALLLLRKNVMCEMAKEKIGKIESVITYKNRNHKKKL